MPKESAYTSLKQIPAAFKKFELGNKNLDVGGGKFDTATDYLKEHGTTNWIFDPYNRNVEWNSGILTLLTNNEVDSITCLNVLNVIKDKKERFEVLNFIRKVVNRHRIGNPPMVFFQIYEGNRSGIPSTKTVQNNMKTVDYIPEIQAMFPEWEVQRQGNFLIV